MSAMEKAVRELAYELWERAGRPDGRSEEFWFAARFELQRREETGEAELGRARSSACGAASSSVGR